MRAAISLLCVGGGDNDHLGLISLSLSLGQDMDDSSEDLTCEGCNQSADACHCAAISASFQQVKAHCLIFFIFFYAVFFCLGQHEAGRAGPSGEIEQSGTESQVFLYIILY